MKLCFIVWSTGISGGTKLVFEISKLFASRGHEVLLLCLGSKQHKWFDFGVEGVKLLYIEPDVYIPFIGRISTYGLIDVARKILRVPYEFNRIKYLVERIPMDYDIYVATYFPSAIALYLSTAKGKKVYFVQDTPELAFENEGYYGLKLFDLSLQLPFDLFVCNSQYVKKYVITKLNGKALISIGGVGIDTRIFKPKTKHIQRSLKEGVKKSKFRVMAFLSRQRIKGSEVALRALNLLSKKLSFNAILVGERPKFARVKIEFPYTFYGVVRPQLLAKLYQLSDLFIFTSYVESFGLPPLEAMACGCPVVTTNCRGNMDYAINYYNSIVVPPGDPNAIADAAYQVLTDEVLRAKLIEGALKTATEWSWDKKFPFLESLFINLLKK